MPKLTRHGWLLLAFAITLLGVQVGALQAQKLRIRSQDGKSSSATVEQDKNGHISIDVQTDDGDSASSVVVHRKIHRKLDDADSTQIVRMWEDITIREGQVVPGDVVSIGGDVTVFGRVKGDVVSVGGDVDLKGEGQVDGDAVSVGGAVHREPGTRIGKQNVSMRFIPSGLLGLGRDRHRGHPFLAVVVAALSLLFAFFIAWLLHVLAEQRMRQISRKIETHLWTSLFVGMGVTVGFPLAFLLLIVTIVGIPLALLSPFALGLAYLIGFLAVAALVGARLAGSGHVVTPISYLRAMANGLLFFGGGPIVGHLLRTIGGPIHFLGVIVIVFAYGAIYIASTIGIGAVVLSRLGRADRPVAPAIPVSPITQPTGI